LKTNNLAILNSRQLVVRRREHLVHTLINSGLRERIFFHAPNCASRRGHEC